MRSRSSFAWATLIPLDGGWAHPGSPLTDCVRPTRQSAIETFVAAWRTDDHAGLTVSKVWQRAYRRGWRLSRVVVTPFGDTP